MFSNLAQEKDFSIAEEALRLRASQLIVNEKYRQGAFKIPIHLAIGHEAIAVALDSIMDDNDCLVLTHRNIHYNLARAKSLKPIIDEYLLKPDGLAHAELGSMNLANPERNTVYASSILGNNLPVATGLALAKKVQGSTGVVFVVTGDGAMEEGAFYESLLLLKSLSLPAVIIVENNNWSMHTRIEERRCQIDIAQFAKSLGVSYHRLNGNDIYEYIESLSNLSLAAREAGCPAVVEVDIVTLGGWHVEAENVPGGRFIHPHAGPVPALALQEINIIEHSSADPIFVLRNHFSNDMLTTASQRIVEELAEELADV